MTTANLRIITPNDGDSATLTASPAMVATLLQTNLQDPARAKVARTTSLASQDIKGAWSAHKTITALALSRHNLTADAVWRLLLYSDTAWTTLAYDSGVLPAVPKKTLGDLEWGVDPLGASVFTGWSTAFAQMWFDPVFARSFIVTLGDAANPAGYLEASRLFIGHHLPLKLNFDWGIKLAWRDDSAQRRTDGGTLRTENTDPNRRMSLQLAWLLPADRPKWVEFARRDGLRKDFWINAYPGEGNALERDHSFAAKLVASPELARPMLRAFTSEYVMEEA